MKRNIWLSIILMIFSCNISPKDTLTLSIYYRPEMTYFFNSEQTLTTVIKFTGKQKALQTLKSRNILNPTITNRKSHTEAIIKTGKLEMDNKFNTKAYYRSVTNNQSDKQSTINATFYGKSNLHSLPEFDIVVIEDLDLKAKKNLLKSWNNTISQFSFSVEELKINEDLIIHSEQSIPMEGSEIELSVITSYKLREIKEKIAYFEINQNYILNPKLMDNSFDGKGRGIGHMNYDMNNSIILSYTLDAELELTKKLDSFEFQLKTNNSIRQTVSVGT